MMPRAALLGLLLVAAATLAGLAPAASAAGSGGFGVTPVELKFVDPPALRGSHLEGVFKVQNRQGTDVEVSATPEGASAPWIRLVPATSFVVPSGESRDVRVVIDVPADAPNGDYTAYLRIRGAPTGNLQGSGSSLAVELVPAVRLRVGGEQTVSFAMDRLEVQGAEAGAPLVMAATLVNQGNVKASPALAVQVADADGNPVLTETLAGDALEPRAGGPMTFATQGLLPTAGAYTVTAVLQSGERAFGEKQLSFEASPRGATGDAMPRGKYTALGLDAAAEKGSPAKVTAGFKNLGTGGITSAKLVAEVYLGEKRVAVLQSDPLAIAPGEEQTLEAYWTPKDAGAYRIVSYVTYDGVKSPTKSDTLQVASGEAAPAPEESEQQASATPTQEKTASTPPPTTASGAKDTTGSDAVPAEPAAKTPAPAGALLLAGLGAAALALRARRRS